MAAIGRVRYPTIEVHISNPARRGTASDIATATRGTVTGFGIVLWLQRDCGVRGWGPDGLGTGAQVQGREGAEGALMLTLPDDPVFGLCIYSGSGQSTAYPIDGRSHS